MATLTFSYDDEKTWDLFKDGRTKGVFQLESNLGRAWSKRLQPTNLDNFHQSLGAGKTIMSNLTNAEQSSSTMWNNTAPTSSVFSVGTYNGTNGSSDNMIAYCFAEKQGYSKFGIYTGNGSTNGTYIHLGFKPAWFMIKSNSNAEAWEVGDNKRDTENVVNNILIANSSGAETAGVAGNRLHCDFVSNGVKLKGNASQANQNGSTYIYLAFAENPFVNSNGVPVNAR